MLIFARFLGAHDPNQILSAAGVDDAIDLAADAPKRDPAELVVVFAVVDSLQSFIQKDCRSGQERDFVLLQIAAGLGLVPLELEFLAHRCLLAIMNTNVYTSQPRASSKLCLR